MLSKPKLGEIYLCWDSFVLTKTCGSNELIHISVNLVMYGNNSNVSIGWDNGLAPTRRQAIILKNDG